MAAPLDWRWSTRWADYQAEYDRDQETVRPHRTKWIQDLTLIIWEHMHSKWRTRAEIVNGNEHTPGRKSLQEGGDIQLARMLAGPIPDDLRLVLDSGPGA